VQPKLLCHLFRLTGDLPFKHGYVAAHACCPGNPVCDDGVRSLGLRGRLGNDGHAGANDAVLQDKALLPLPGARTRVLQEDVGYAITLHSGVFD